MVERLDRLLIAGGLDEGEVRAVRWRAGAYAAYLAMTAGALILAAGTALNIA